MKLRADTSEHDDEVVEPEEPGKGRVIIGNFAAHTNTRNHDASIEAYRQVLLSLFVGGGASKLSTFGFTSVSPKEGKTFLAYLAASLLANDCARPITLLEINWEHPSLHKSFGVPATPGLAEYLRGECREDQIYFQVRDNLTIVPAGAGKYDAARLIERLRNDYVPDLLARSKSIVLFDLPPLVSCGYGMLAASLPEQVGIVVRAGKTPMPQVARAYEQLQAFTTSHLILNDISSRIPGWLRSLL